MRDAPFPFPFLPLPPLPAHTDLPEHALLRPTVLHTREDRHGHSVSSCLPGKVAVASPPCRDSSLVSRCLSDCPRKHFLVGLLPPLLPRNAAPLSPRVYYCLCCCRGRRHRYLVAAIVQLSRPRQARLNSYPSCA